MTELFDRLAARWKDTANLVLGLWLIVSPWALSYAAQQIPARNAWIVGVLIAILALATLTAFQQWEEWLSVALGAWLIVSPWVLGFAAQQTAMWNQIAVGAVVAFLALWVAMTETGGLARG